MNIAFIEKPFISHHSLTFHVNANAHAHININIYAQNLIQLVLSVSLKTSCNKFCNT